MDDGHLVGGGFDASIPSFVHPTSNRTEDGVRFFGDKSDFLKNMLHECAKPIRSAYRKIVLGGTTGRRTIWCGGLYLFRGKCFSA
jgi:hypothetical protein